MKKLISLSLMLLMSVSLLAGCGNSSKSGADNAKVSGEQGSSKASSAAGETQQATSNVTKKDTYKIGVVQLVEHSSLNDAYRGFAESLEQYGAVNGIKFEIELKNAQNDQSNCNTISSKFVNDKVDLILAIATPAAQAAANATKEAGVPVLFTAVTDPVDAQLVESNEKPGSNVTGTSDLTPVSEQIGLIKELVPDIKSVGVLYASSESNSKVQVELAKTAAEKLGIEVVQASVSNANEVQSVVQNVLAGKVQAIYAPTDNTIANAMPTVSAIAQEYKLPIITGANGMVAHGGLATIGMNYYDLGVKTADMALQILVDGKKPAELPVSYIDSYSYCYNSKVAAALGMEKSFSADFLAKATDVAE